MHSASSLAFLRFVEGRNTRKPDRFEKLDLGRFGGEILKKNAGPPPLMRVVFTVEFACNHSCSAGFTYRLKPRASRSKGVSSKMWYA